MLVSAGFKRNAGRRRNSFVLAVSLALLNLVATGTSLAAGDTAKGRAAFVRQCAICHTVERGGDNRFGPNLFGIVGRKAGSAPGFAYSNAFKTRANWEWTEDALGGWAMFPGTMVPGTAMGVFQGIAERDRDDLVAALATLK
jgi:cytochrome c